MPVIVHLQSSTTARCSVVLLYEAAKAVQHFLSGQLAKDFPEFCPVQPVIKGIVVRLMVCVTC